MKDQYKTKEQHKSGLVEVYPGVFVVQLNGTGDNRSMQQLMELLPERSVETSSSVALIDLTDMPSVDTQMAQHLVDSIGAVLRLGTRVILTGVRPSIYQKLAHLGTDPSSITTYSFLVAGLWAALDIVESQVASQTSRG